MVKTELLTLLTSNRADQNIPDADKHWPSPTYIRALITRARVVNGRLKREQVADKCGTSLSSLDKYTKPYDNVTCPYVMQYALENLAGINSCERASLFRLEMSVGDSDARFFRDFDEFKASRFSAIKVSVLIALTRQEEIDIKSQWKKATLEKQEI